MKHVTQTWSCAHQTALGRWREPRPKVTHAVETTQTAGAAFDRGPESPVLLLGCDSFMWVFVRRRSSMFKVTSGPRKRLADNTAHPSSLLSSFRLDSLLGWGTMSGGSKEPTHSTAFKSATWISGALIVSVVCGVRSHQVLQVTGGRRFSRCCVSVSLSFETQKDPAEDAYMVDDN